MEGGRGAPRRIRVTEGSCWPCRDRRVKCDTQKPRCGRCAAQNQECDYSKVRLRWGNQVPSRGRLASQSALAPTSPLDDHALSRRDSGSSWHLLYFASEILTRFSISDVPTVSDLDAISRDLALSNTVLAVTHTHLLVRNLSMSGETIRENIEARTNAIQSFRQKLQQQSSCQTPDTFYASVLLCMLDGIMEPQEDSAATRIHYQGGKAIIQQNNTLDLLLRERRGLPALLLTVFATMDLTHALLSGAFPIFGPESWRLLAGGDAWWTGLQSDTAFLELMALLSQIARLGHEVYREGTLPAMRVVLAVQLSLERTKTIPRDNDATESSLGMPDPRMPDSGSADADPPCNLDDRAFCAAYRSAAGIYMYRVLCGLLMTDDLVQQCVNEGMEAICRTSFQGKHPHCLLFPILIIGSHCLDVEGRSTILQTLDPTLNYLGFGSVKELREFLLAVWQKQDNASNWWQFFHPIATRAFIF